MKKKQMLATLVMLSLLQGSVYAEDKIVSDGNLIIQGFDKTFDNVDVTFNLDTEIDAMDYNALQILNQKLTVNDTLKVVLNVSGDGYGGTGILFNGQSDIITVGNGVTVEVIDTAITTSWDTYKVGVHLDSYGPGVPFFDMGKNSTIVVNTNDDGRGLVVWEGTVTGENLTLEVDASKGNTATGVFSDFYLDNHNDANINYTGIIDMDVIADGKAVGLQSYFKDDYIFNADNGFDMTVTSNSSVAQGIYLKGSNAEGLKIGSGVITVNAAQKADGIVVEGTFNETKANDFGALDVTVTSNNATATGLDVSASSKENLKFKDFKADVDGKNTSYGIISKNAAKADFDGVVELNVSGADNSTAIKADDKSVLTFNDGLIVNAQDGYDNKIYSLQADNANVNANKGNVLLNGNISAKNSANVDLAFNNGLSVFKGATELDDENSSIKLDFKNSSRWDLTGNSRLSELVVAENAVVNMTADDNAFSTIMANDILNSGGTFNMDIDASTNENNSDRVYVDGTHSGTHYITLNNVGANTDGAEGTVLVSVNDEHGKFEANDSEGALYWNRYDLDSKESTTDGYNTDWYLKEVEQLDEPTTSVDTILGANALGYHTWRAETDKLMKRMGDLRHNGEDEKGAWFRVRGAEISRDGEASFENKYTVYELGYDEITKKTDRFTRYQGAALSYIDGTSSFARGSGENDGKSIAFYTTEMRNKGHYLDLVFRIADMDSDYKVYDTNGNKITGEPENVGVSLSAEYGRKKVMDDNGWYIEPQGQLTVGYFGGDNYRAKYADQYIDVHQSGIPSVLGRIGFNIGRDIDENTNIYLKANLLHEFCGDYDVDMVDSAGNRRTESDTFNDTWFEYGIGAAIKTGKNNHLYFDFEKTAGGDFEKDWAWNAGMRWTF